MTARASRVPATSAGHLRSRSDPVAADRVLETGLCVSRWSTRRRSASPLGPAASAASSRSRTISTTARRLTATPAFAASPARAAVPPTSPATCARSARAPFAASAGATSLAWIRRRALCIGRVSSRHLRRSRSWSRSGSRRGGCRARPRHPLRPGRGTRRTRSQRHHRRHHEHVPGLHVALPGTFSSRDRLFPLVPLVPPGPTRPSRTSDRHHAPHRPRAVRARPSRHWRTTSLHPCGPESHRRT